MKRIYFFLVMTIAFAMFAVPEKIEAQSVSFTNTLGAQYLAKDSTLANATTKVSQIQTMFAKGTSVSTSVNYLEGAKLIVIGKQANDSTHALIYVQAGQIFGGTKGTNYGEVLVDSLTVGKPSVIIDLAKFLFFPEVGVKVVGSAAGNGVSATFSVMFGGAGMSVTTQ